MAVARKRSGFMNDCRSYCYSDCNIIQKSVNIFPSVTTPCGTPNCNKPVGTNTNRYLGIQNRNMINNNLINNYNNTNMKYL
jgi:hypothetical protein